MGQNFYFPFLLLSVSTLLIFIPSTSFEEETRINGLSPLDCLPGDECKVIIVFTDLSECKIPESFDSKLLTSNDGKLSAKKLHRHVMVLLEEKLDLLIKKKTDPLRKNQKALEALNNQGKQIEGNVSSSLDTRYLENLGMEIFRLPESLTVSDAVEASEGLPCIEFVSPDYVVFPDIPSNEASKLPNLRKNSNEEGKLKPNDPYYSVQWHLQENGTRFGQIWAHAKSFPEITVAVIDSGCDLSHPDLQDSYWKNPDEICDDGIDNDGNGYVDDCYGWDFVGRDNNPDAEKSTHGVAVAGVIAAQIDNSIGIAGICANCKIMCLRFMGAKGGKVTDEVAALDYALTKGVRISNNSYGDYGGSLAERWAVERSRKFQHLFVTSAGNNNRDTDDGKNFHTPSAYPFDNILAVGSSTAGGERAPYSNYGKFSVDILAPGTNIVTLLSGGKYTVLSGTSFAAPSVAAAAALVWSKYPTLSYLSVVDVLVNTCHTINETNEKWSRCRGILDIPMALKRAQQLTSLEEVTETVKLS